MGFWRALSQHISSYSLGSWMVAFFTPGEERKAYIVSVTLIALSAKLAKVDGRVTRDEVAAFKKLVHFDDKDELFVRRLFDLTRQSSAGYEYYAKQAARILSDSPQRLRDILTGLMIIAGADGKFDESEHTFIAKVAEIFGLSKNEFCALAANYGDPHAYCPYAILGIEQGSRRVEIRHAYRALARQYHPDVLDAQGVSKELHDLAQARMAQINRAYQQLMSEGP